MPSATSLGIGNTPPTLTYGPGVQNFDVAIQKNIPLGKGDSTKVLSFKAEAYNLLNHFNPGTPTSPSSLSLAINCNPVNGQCTPPSGIKDYTSTTFGTITTAQIQARHIALTVRFRF